MGIGKVAADPHLNHAVILLTCHFRIEKPEPPTQFNLLLILPFHPSVVVLGEGRPHKAALRAPTERVPFAADGQGHFFTRFGSRCNFHHPDRDGAEFVVEIVEENLQFRSRFLFVIFVGDRVKPTLNFLNLASTIGRFGLRDLLTEFIENIPAEVFQVVFMIEPFDRIFFFLTVHEDKDKLRFPVGIGEFPFLRFDGYLMPLTVSNVPLTFNPFPVIEILGTDHPDIPGRTDTTTDMTQNAAGNASDRSADNTEDSFNNAFPSRSDINAVVHVTENLSPHARNVRSHRLERSGSSGSDIQSG